MVFASTFSPQDADGAHSFIVEDRRVAPLFQENLPAFARRATPCHTTPFEKTPNITVPQGQADRGIAGAYVSGRCETPW